mmetsp:Transcript_16970/g.46011  ORF Transcript_16970/g.46011 Transcript_16970/m.46011 type:complete len:139 (-) Transcript_16970:217-633(-)
MIRGAHKAPHTLFGRRLIQTSSHRLRPESDSYTCCDTNIPGCNSTCFGFGRDAADIDLAAALDTPTTSELSPLDSRTVSSLVVVVTPWTQNFFLTDAHRPSGVCPARCARTTFACDSAATEDIVAACSFDGPTFLLVA